MTDKKNGYKTLGNYWLCDEEKKENYFVAYAVRGPMMVPSMGLEAGLPVDHPIPGPVSEPSILNTRWKYSRPWPKSSIL
jgi:hypothetical protein